ncbi:MAG: hypothetical protein FJY92_01445 [Candidatus Hydrogenedentes bacterium]|nr:hypothetical protein [Candidatus Hydrogenedentota bacterium]
MAIVPVHAFEQPAWRERYRAKFKGALDIPGDFPPDEAWKRWPLERPNEFAMLNLQMRLGAVRDTDFIDLMLWEFMRGNFAKRPVCFAGVSPAWLTARGQRSGVVLHYPRTANREPRPIDSAVPTGTAAAWVDPELAKTAVALLLPLAEAGRRQDDPAGSARIAQLARSYGANDAGAWLASARAAAREGKREQAVEFSSNYIRLAPSERDTQVFLDLIEEDLRRNRLATEFHAAGLSQDPSTDARKQRMDLAKQLWGLDEVTVLSETYTKAIANGPEDIELLYEGAAAAAQLGDLNAARERLGRAVQIDSFAIWGRLQVDGRFFLLEADLSLTAPPPGISG